MWLNVSFCSELSERSITRASEDYKTLGNILDYKPPVEDDNLEEQYPEQIDNQRGDYSSLFGTLSERDLDA